MGQLTRAQIITQGMTMAGKATTALASVVGTDWDAWLRSTYKSWLWPYLLKQWSNVPLAAGAQALQVGAGQGTVTDSLSEIFDPMYVHTSDYQTRGEARVRNIRGGSVNIQPAVVNPTTDRGMPALFKVQPGLTQGNVFLYPYPIPDRAYLLTFDYKLVPNHVTDNQIPRYENDRTLIQAAKVFTLQYMKLAAEAAQELEILAAMVSQDQGKEGVMTGANDSVGLDSKTFRRR